MFTDWQQALEAESLPLNPSTDQELAAACRVTARNASDKDDLAHLLDALGAPTDEDTFTALLPLLPSPDAAIPGETMTTQTTNAYAAVAASMLTSGDSPEKVRTTLGLSDTELAEAVKQAESDLAADLADTDSTQTADAEPGETPRYPTQEPVADSEIEALLTWAENHPAAARRAADAAQREAEERVARAKAELEAAQAQLREVKAGGRTSTASPTTTPPAPAPAPTGKRSKEQLTAIRTWARTNGHQVADRGTPAKAVMDAYDTAHPQAVAG